MLHFTSVQRIYKRYAQVNITNCEGNMETKERYIIARIKRSMARTRRILRYFPTFNAFLNTDQEKECLEQIKNRYREYLEQMEDVCIAKQADDISEPELEPLSEESLNIQFLSRETSILLNEQYDIAKNLGISPELLTMIRAGVESQQVKEREQEKRELLISLRHLIDAYTQNMKNFTETTINIDALR